MGLFTTPTQKPNKFNYVPRYHDPVKEELEERIADAKERYHGEKTERKRTVRFSFRDEMKHEPKKQNTTERTRRFETSYGKVSPMRLVAIFALLVAMLWFIFVYQF